MGTKPAHVDETSKLSIFAEDVREPDVLAEATSSGERENPLGSHFSLKNRLNSLHLI